VTSDISIIIACKKQSQDPAQKIKNKSQWHIKTCQFLHYRVIELSAKSV
jgi:hypothetical protein